MERSLKKSQEEKDWLCGRYDENERDLAGDLVIVFQKRTLLLRACTCCGVGEHQVRVRVTINSHVNLCAIRGGGLKYWDTLQIATFQHQGGQDTSILKAHRTILCTYWVTCDYEINGTLSFVKYLSPMENFLFKLRLAITVSRSSALLITFFQSLTKYFMTSTK